MIKSIADKVKQSYELSKQKRNVRNLVESIAFFTYDYVILRKKLTRNGFEATKKTMDDEILGTYMLAKGVQHMVRESPIISPKEKNLLETRLNKQIGLIENNLDQTRLEQDYIAHASRYLI